MNDPLPPPVDLARVRVVIPARDEEPFIADVVAGCALLTPHILVVCDHCTDRTEDRARMAGARVEQNTVLFGKGAALRVGWTAWLADSDWDFLVILDGDGQHDPAHIPALVEALSNSANDMVVGSRAPFSPPMPWLRRWTNRFMSWVTSGLSGSRIEDSQCGFRVIRRDLLESRSWKGNGFDLETEMIVVAAHRGGVIHGPIRCRYASESSSIEPIRDTLTWLRMLWMCAVHR